MWVVKISETTQLKGVAVTEDNTDLWNKLCCWARGTLEAALFYASLTYSGSYLTGNVIRLTVSLRTVFLKHPLFLHYVLAPVGAPGCLEMFPQLWRVKNQHALQDTGEREPHRRAVDGRSLRRSVWKTCLSLGVLAASSSAQVQPRKHRHTCFALSGNQVSDSQLEHFSKGYKGGGPLPKP